MQTCTNPIECVRQRLETFQQRSLRLVQGYGECYQEAHSAELDITSAQPLVDQAALDTTKTLVADLGLTALNRVELSIQHLRHNEVSLPELVRMAQGSNILLEQCIKDLTPLAGDPQIAGCLELLNRTASLHLVAARSAGWAQSKALLADRELIQSTNDLRLVAADRLDTSVALEAGRVVLRLASARDHCHQQVEFLSSTQNDQEQVSLYLEQLDSQLEQCPSECGGLDHQG